MTSTPSLSETPNFHEFHDPGAMRASLVILRKSFSRSLKAENKSERTVGTYCAAVDKFIDFLESPPAATGNNPDDESPAQLLARRPVRDECDIRRAHVEAFIAHTLAHWKPLTAINYFGGLQQWFKWMVAQDDIEVAISPMTGMRKPTAPEEYPPVISAADIKAIMKTCDLKTFSGIRDAAIIHLFADTGIRLAEITGLMAVEVIDNERVPTVDLDTCDVYVKGKGRRFRTVAFGNTTALALDRYMRRRAKHPLRERPELWLTQYNGHRGVMTGSGIRQMLNRRSADLQHIHPHLWRHTWADAQKKRELSKEDLKRQGGWKSDAMVERYGAAEAENRARDAHRKRSFMDNL